MNLANVVSKTKQAVNSGVFMPVSIESLNDATDWQRSIILYINDKEEINAVLPIAAKYSAKNERHRGEARESGRFWLFRPIQLDEENVSNLTEQDNLYIIQTDPHDNFINTNCLVYPLQGMDIRSFLNCQIEKATTPTIGGIASIDRTIPSLRKKFFQGR